MTKQELIALFSNGHLVTGGDFENLINSLKGVQSPVSDPSASGTSVTFIATITQDAEGKIVVTKKNVNFGGYVPISMMGGYQAFDLQQTGDINVGTGDKQLITHNKEHYPVVRLLDSGGQEVMPTEYRVTHHSDKELTIQLGSTLTGRYKYVLD